METTPRTISDTVLRLRRRIGLSSEPVFVPVSPVREAGLQECHNNVDAYIREQGGSAVHGWCVWENPGRIIEGQFHTIWRSPAGELLDITPQHDGEPRILFIPDPDRQPDGRPVDNVRIPLCPDRALRWKIRLAEEIFRLRCRFAGADGQARIPAGEVIAAAEAVTERNDPCPCWSGRSFKDCCRRLSGNARASIWLKTLQMGPNTVEC